MDDSWLYDHPLDKELYESKVLAEANRRIGIHTNQENLIKQLRKQKFEEDVLNKVKKLMNPEYQSSKEIRKQFMEQMRKTEKNEFYNPSQQEE